MYSSRFKNNSRTSKQSIISTTRASSLIKEETRKTCRNESQYKIEQGCPPVPSCEVPQKVYCSSCRCCPCTCPQNKNTCSSGTPFTATPSPQRNSGTPNYSNIPSLVSNESFSHTKNHALSKLSYSATSNSWKVWRQWKSEKLSQVIHNEVQKLFATMLPIWGLNTQLLLKLNGEMTYGLIGTSYVGNEKDLQTAAILYPNVGNMVQENGVWKELRTMRMVLTANRIEGLFSSITRLSQSQFSLSEALISLFHEFMHALIRKSKCPGSEIALSAEKKYSSANEELAQALTNVIIAKAKYSPRELAQGIQQAKLLGGNACLELLLQNKNLSHFNSKNKYQSKLARSHNECSCQKNSKSHQECKSKSARSHNECSCQNKSKFHRETQIQRKSLQNGYCSACYCKPCTCVQHSFCQPATQHSNCCCCCCCCPPHPQNCEPSSVGNSSPSYGEDFGTPGADTLSDLSDTFDETPTFEDIVDIESSLKSPSKTLREAFRKLVKHIGSWRIDNSALIEIVEAPTTKFVELGTPEAGGITVALDNTGIKGVITEFNEEGNYSYTFYLTSSDKTTMLEGKFYTQQSDPIGNSQHGYGTIKYLTEGIATDIGSTYLLKALAVTKCALCQDDYGLGKLSGGNRKAINELRLVFFNKLILSKGFEFIPSSGASSFNPYWETEFQEYYQEKLDENLKVLREYIGGQICGEILGLFVGEFVEKSLETRSSSHYPKPISKFPYHNTTKSNALKRQIDFQEKKPEIVGKIVKPTQEEIDKTIKKLRKKQNLLFEITNGLNLPEESETRIKTFLKSLNKWGINGDFLSSVFSECSLGVFNKSSGLFIPEKGFYFDEGKTVNGFTWKGGNSIKPFSKLPKSLPYRLVVVKHRGASGPNKAPKHESELEEWVLDSDQDLIDKISFADKLFSKSKDFSREDFLKLANDDGEKEKVEIGVKIKKDVPSHEFLGQEIQGGDVIYPKILLVHPGKKPRIVLRLRNDLTYLLYGYFYERKRQIKISDNCHTEKEFYSYEDPSSYSVTASCNLIIPGNWTLTFIHELLHCGIAMLPDEDWSRKLFPADKKSSLAEARATDDENDPNEENFVQKLTDIIRLKGLLYFNSSPAVPSLLKDHWTNCLEKIRLETRDMVKNSFSAKVFARIITYEEL